MARGNAGFYPVVLRLRGRRVLIVGGGKVAARKAAGLLEVGAHVTVVSQSFAPAFARVVDTAGLRLIERRYAGTDLDGMALVVAATDNRKVNAQVRVDARRAGVLVSVVDDLQKSDFIVPAVVRRGDLLLAISTGGRSPALAGHLRRELDSLVSDDWGALVKLLGAARARVQAAVGDPERRQDVMKRLATLDLLSTLRNSGSEAATSQIEALIAPMAARTPARPQVPATDGENRHRSKRADSPSADTQTLTRPRNGSRRSARDSARPAAAAIERRGAR